ncbi:zinc finger protein 771-like [Branchiostoma floridae]|uniref:Zinc finger protein 771-like n=1 Tax=Branchiostoma floridae TaxID=7739 RepID=A0A9J7KKU9_BRAFL|nr:zinc finger protein 771-like [Branchiostoma floridae]
MEDSGLELFCGEQCAGDPGKESKSTEHPGKESDSRETQTTDMGLQQETCDVNFPQPDNTSTSQVQESKGDMGSRVVKHTGEKPFMCGECGYRTVQMSDLTKHMRIHTGERPYKCDQCDFSAAQKLHMDRHTAMHTGDNDKPYICAECGYRATHKCTLAYHMRTHTGENPTTVTIVTFLHHIKAI